MLLAMILVVGVLLSFKVFFPSPPAAPAPESAPAPAVAAAPVLAPEKTVAAPLAAASAGGRRIALENAVLKGSFEGGRMALNNLSLLKYRATADEDSPIIQLLGAAYFATLDWASADSPHAWRTEDWKVSGDKLTPQTPLVLTWQNQAVRIQRTLSLDDGYLLTLADTVQNLTQEPVSVSLTGTIRRHEQDVPRQLSVVHEGFIGLFNQRATEERYADVRDDAVRHATAGGWVGMTDKYWQTVFVPDSNASSKMAFSHADGYYVAAFQTLPAVVPAGGTLTQTTRLFAGAKETAFIHAYRKNLGIAKFDLTIDYGWFYFLTKPFLYFLAWLKGLVGNMGIAILIFATLLRIALLPIATKSYQSMAQMRKIQPKIKDLQTRFKDDRPRLQQEMMNLYKRDKVNPAAGCLPILIQIPVFFALYKVLSVSILMRQAPFFGWIQDLSVRDGSSVFTLFGLAPWPIPGILDIGVWPLLMGLTMWVQQRLGPQATDPTQRTMMRLLPIVFTFMLGNFAAGLVIYWTWSNLLSLAQQKYIMKKVGVN